MTACLRLGRAFRDTLKGAIGHPRALFTASVQPFLLEVALLAALLVLDRDGALFGGPFGGGSPLFAVAAIPLSLLPLVLLAVRWHRFLLLGEAARPRLFSLPIWADLAYWLYISSFLLVAFAPVVALILFAESHVVMGPLDTPDTVATQPERTSPLVWVFTVAAPLFAALFLYLFARLCPVLPASAIGSRSAGLAAAWRMIRGNGWRIWLLLLPLTQLFLLANAFVSFWSLWVFTPYITMVNPLFAIGALMLFAWLLHGLMTALFASLLSAVYLQIAPEGTR